MGKLSLVTETTIAHKHRIFFVDALRGTAIIFMLMLHVPQYCRLNGDFWRTMADIFCMPLFFVLSGYVLNIPKIIFKKRATILIPFLSILVVLLSLLLSRLLYQLHLGFLFGRK